MIYILNLTTNKKMGIIVEVKNFYGFKILQYLKCDIGQFYLVKITTLSMNLSVGGEWRMSTQLHVKFPDES